MKFGIKNLGPIKEADIELGDLTIICGKNNSGKTYLTYSIYSFLETLSSNIIFDIKRELVLELISTGSCVINFEDLWRAFPEKLNNILPAYSRCIPRFLAIQNKRETKEQIQFTISEYGGWKNYFYKVAFDNQDEPISLGKDIVIFSSKEKNSYEINCSLESKTPNFPSEDKLSNALVKKLSCYIMEKMLPFVFGLTGERSGIAIFGDFLNRIARERDVNEKYKETDNLSKNKINVEFEYSLPLRDEVNYLLNLKHFKRNSSTLEGLKKILDTFADIAGGEYSCDDHSTIQFIDKNSKERYLITETSSSVKSLTELFFYIKHIASPGQILMIDEPELNLHPENQRKIARLLAMLVNSGIRVFITTHSDYVVREFDFMTRLFDHKQLAQRLGYPEGQLLRSISIRKYIVERANKSTQYVLKKIAIDQESGIENSSFDSSIEEMNHIQQAIQMGDILSDDDFTPVED